MTDPNLSIASTASANRPIEVGLFVPPSGIPHLGGISSWNDLVAFAIRAEALGFDSLWLADHLLLDFGPDKDRIGLWDCWSLLAALAAATSRIELGPLVSCTGYRNPAMLAKNGRHCRRDQRRPSHPRPGRRLARVGVSLIRLSIRPSRQPIRRGSPDHRSPAQG
jgi:hypothetical protein